MAARRGAKRSSQVGRPLGWFLRGFENFCAGGGTARARRRGWGASHVIRLALWWQNPLSMGSSGFGVSTNGVLLRRSERSRERLMIFLSLRVENAFLTTDLKCEAQVYEPRSFQNQCWAAHRCLHLAASKPARKSAMRLLRRTAQSLCTNSTTEFERKALSSKRSRKDGCGLASRAPSVGHGLY